LADLYIGSYTFVLWLSCLTRVGRILISAVKHNSSRATKSTFLTKVYANQCINKVLHIFAHRLLFNKKRCFYHEKWVWESQSTNL